MSNPLTPTPAPTLSTATIEQVTNGYIVTQQRTNGIPFGQQTRQVYNDFAEAVSALSTIFGVDLPVDAINTAVSAAQAAKTPQTPVQQQ
jgi:hypothetical protein